MGEGSEVKVRWRRHPAEVREPYWDPEPEGTPDDHRFTERNDHFQRLYEQMRRAQWSPAYLTEISDDDLIYIAGHVEPPWEVVARPPESAPEAERIGWCDQYTRWHKLRQNAERAAKELQRRQASRLHWRVGVVAAVISAAASVAAVVVAGMIVVWTHQ
jgi:hypothetical protein